MRRYRTLLNTLAVATLALSPVGAGAQVTPDAPAGRPAAIVNLMTDEGTNLVKAQWRYSDVKILDVDHRDPGQDLRPSGLPNRTYDIVPHAGAADFDDTAWAVLRPGELEARKGHGRLSFNWYRTKLTIPDRIGGIETTGTTLVFEIVVDDYAEVWLDGKLPSVLGQTGGALVKGFNAPNRVVLTRDARPGQTFQLA